MRYPRNAKDVRPGLTIYRLKTKYDFPSIGSARQWVRIRGYKLKPARPTFRYVPYRDVSNESVFEFMRDTGFSLGQAEKWAKLHGVTFSSNDQTIREECRLMAKYKCETMSVLDSAMFFGADPRDIIHTRKEFGYTTDNIEPFALKPWSVARYEVTEVFMSKYSDRIMNMWFGVTRQAIHMWREIHGMPRCFRSSNLLTISARAKYRLIHRTALFYEEFADVVAPQKPIALPCSV